MVDFAGFLMPVQYTGIIQEHMAVREAAGLFDVSHMGEFMISGAGDEAFLNHMMINDVRVLKVGQAQYSAMCYEDGGIVDDLLIYRYKDSYMLVVNAANVEKDFQWLDSHRPDDVHLVDVSDQIGLVALQGALSRDILQKVTAADLDNLSFYSFIEEKISGKPATIARTGYTGELGFEIYADMNVIQDIWSTLIQAGKPFGIQPVGLGCRDTLRMEMKYCLYGNDIDETTNPIEAGLGWITKVDRGDFLGRSAILKAKENSSRRLVCIEMVDRAIPRKGYKVLSAGTKVGEITSGTQSPSLKKGIGLAYVARNYASSGTELTVDVRGRMMKAIVVKHPFYRKDIPHT